MTCSTLKNFCLQLPANKSIAGNSDSCLSFTSHYSTSQNVWNSITTHNLFKTCIHVYLKKAYGLKQSQFWTLLPSCTEAPNMCRLGLICARTNDKGLMWAMRISSWYPNVNGSHFGLPPSSFHTQKSWTGWQFRANYDVWAQASFVFLWTFFPRIHTIWMKTAITRKWMYCWHTAIV